MLATGLLTLNRCGSWIAHHGNTRGEPRAKRSTVRTVQSCDQCSALLTELLRSLWAAAHPDNRLGSDSLILCLVCGVWLVCRTGHRPTVICGQYRLSIGQQQRFVV